jgi:hypothetical protein
MFETVGDVVYFTRKFGRKALIVALEQQFPNVDDREYIADLMETANADLQAINVTAGDEATIFVEVSRILSRKISPHSQTE